MIQPGGGLTNEKLWGQAAAMPSTPEAHEAGPSGRSISAPPHRTIPAALLKGLFDLAAAGTMARCGHRGDSQAQRHSPLQRAPGLADQRSNHDAHRGGRLPDRLVV